MTFTPINFSHQDMLNEKFKKLNLAISEYSFANIYLFRNVHQYQLYFDKELFIHGLTRDGQTYLMPTFNLTENHAQDFESWLNEVDCLFPIPEEWIKDFDPEIFSCTHLEEDSDYLYDIEKIKTYSGRHLDGKRNLVKYLLKNHEITTKSISNETIQDGIEILEFWQSNQAMDKTQTDYYSCKEALELYERLQLSGLLVYVDQKPKGFLLGEKQGTTHFSIHFAKADKTIKGLYPYIYQALATCLDSCCQFVRCINMEQDLDIPEVRLNKQSYRPDNLVHKSRIAKRN